MDSRATRRSPRTLIGTAILLFVLGVVGASNAVLTRPAAKVVQAQSGGS